MAAQFEDSGEYFCLAENKLGRINHRAELTVLGKFTYVTFLFAKTVKQSLSLNVRIILFIKIRKSLLHAYCSSIDLANAVALLQCTVTGRAGRRGRTARRRAAAAHSRARASVTTQRHLTAAPSVAATARRRERVTPAPVRVSVT